MERTFLEFANKVPFYGFSVLCQDHPVVQRLIPDVRRRVVTYGFARTADYRASSVEPDGLVTRFRVWHGDEAELRLPGRHNVANAVGAIAVARELDVPFDVIVTALAGFTGVERRFSGRGEADDVLVIDDYAHHPVEIRATLEAAEEGFADRRIVAVFQPHRYSRVQSLWADFCSAFNRAAVVLVCPVYAAGEAPIDGVDHERIAGELRDRGHRGAEAVTAHVEPGDLVVTLGAGSVNRICDPLLVALEDR